jgi:pyruvate/2-oxoglutarate/acetoin dehydrogenase E1 component
MMFVRELNAVLRRCLENDPRVVLLGEDILDPYGGAFKVTKGLSTDFPSRVLTTPISEGAIAGVAAGLALSGFRPIAEIMFGDFLSLCFDQLLNHIAKYEAMYAGQAACPVIIRTPSGGHRGYGPTHSQSLEKYFVGIPHLNVVAASLYHDPAAVFEQLLSIQKPTLYIEHKLLYPQELAVPAKKRLGAAMAGEDASPGYLPTVTLSYVPRSQCTATVLAYGYQAFLAAQVIEALAMEDEIFVELVVPAQIAPIDWAPIERSVRATGSLITVEEGTSGWSWGSEVAATIGRRLFGELRRPVEIVASAAEVIPSAKSQEREVLTGLPQIRRAVREAAA